MATVRRLMLAGAVVWVLGAVLWTSGIWPQLSIEIRKVDSFWSTPDWAAPVWRRMPH